MNPAPYFDFRFTYNATLKAWEVEAVGLPYTVYDKNEVLDHPYNVPRLLKETATTDTVEQKPNGMGDMGFKARTFWKTPLAAWKAAAKTLEGKKALTLEETEKAVAARAEKERLERIKFLKAELKRLGA